MLSKFLFPFVDFLWILQQEEYETSRYLKWLRRFFFRRGFVTTGRLTYTSRALLTLSLSLGVFLLMLGGAFFVLGLSLQFVVVSMVLLLCIPFFVLLGHLLLSPITSVLHARVRTRAAALVRARPAMKVVGIAGSYGKTTTKYFVHDLTRHSYKTQMIPGNINTLTGISEWLLRHLGKDTELLILEMDAYKKGEIAATCAITPPSIGILTSVGEQHMERFRTLERLCATLRELYDSMPAEGVFIADAKTMEAIGVTDTPVDTSVLTYAGRSIEVPELSASNKENLARALRVAEALAVPADFVVDACASLTIPDRRQKPGTVLGYEGIDDSYNIALSTARAALTAARAFADAKGKKLLVVAAGITELGPDEKDGNVRLGEAIGASADAVVVLSSMFAPDILMGVGTKIPVTSFARFADFERAAHEAFPPSSWVLLLEPTLGDLFY